MLEIYFWNAIITFHDMIYVQLHYIRIDTLSYSLFHSITSANDSEAIVSTGAEHLTRLVKSWAGVYMGVDHRQVEWSDSEVHVCDSQEHGAVDSWVASESAHVWLDSHASVAGDVRDWRIGGVKLRYP